MAKNRLEGRWACVTGASSGIGLGVAQALAARGASIILVARSVDKLQALAQELRESGAGQVRVVPGDLSRAAEVDKIAQAVLELVQIAPGADPGVGHGLYMLVNNAGAAAATAMTAMDGDPDKWDEMMYLNANAPMRLTRWLAPAMAEAAKTGGAEGAAPGQGAVIINVGSVAGVEPIQGAGVYCTSKYAFRGWSLCCNRDLRAHNIKVTIIEPGYVDTPLVPDSAGDRQRMIKVDDISAAILMVSDMSLACCPEELVLRPVLPVVPLAPVTLKPHGTSP